MSTPEAGWGAKYQQQDLQEAHDFSLLLGEITARFAKIERVPRYPDGHRENDVEHSFHLAITATEIAASYFPQLDFGLVSQFSIVHDLPEVYAGDTPTFGASEETLKKKEEAESKATERLLNELPDHTADLLERYEKQEEPEARFVRLVDKLLPSIINAVAVDANTFSEDYGMENAAQVWEGRATRTSKLREMFPEDELEFLFELRESLSKTSIDRLFTED